ncbi:unnamed protein product [Prorocentrum cordatum]|uniref:Prolyl 4-hydroxylase alpha subunit domain-containing protein n=1 Tax=Prorocentrum cordatum TaxID=2364126 RepID=A0ABN9X312_9DINO|nr:unnamed protein product [Polarella glacialis]
MAPRRGPLGAPRLAGAAAALGGLWRCWRPGAERGGLLVALLPGPARHAGSHPAVARARCGRAAGSRRCRRRAEAVARGAYVDTMPIDEQYPLEALHEDLFDPRGVEAWVLPEVRSALSRWREEGDPSLIDLEALPGARVEAPGVFSFRLLEEGVCRKLLEEVKHYGKSKFPQVAPNSMNRDGAVLNDIGLRPCFTILLRRYLLGIGARLFGEESHRASTLSGVPLGTDDWGGSKLSIHHTFVVRYTPETDRGLDMHVDDCDVTCWRPPNVGLVDGGAYSGGELTFCGMYGEAG